VRRFFTLLRTAWRGGRCYGRALRLRKKGDRDAAFRAATAGVDGILQSGLPASPALLSALLSTLCGLTALIDELARECERPEMARAALSGTIDYWRCAIGAQPGLETSTPMRDYIAYFDYRLNDLARTVEPRTSEPGTSEPQNLRTFGTSEPSEP
jgi:hypothetical protein